MSEHEGVGGEEGDATPPTLLATVAQFEARHGPADERVSALLEDATALILEELVGSEAEWVSDGEVDPPAIVVATCIQIAYRAWANPDGVSSERLGAASRTYESGHGPNVLYLTKAEARRLRRAAGTSAVTSVPVESPYSGDPDRATSDLDFWPLP